MKIATFRVDVTPPVGSPLCGGLVAPVGSVADPQYAIGLVLLDGGPPVVLCAVDWCEINNGTHLAWRAALAQAVATTPDRVALHTVHQHNAPIGDLEANRVLAEVGLAELCDRAHVEGSIARCAAAARAAIGTPRRVTHAAAGRAVVREVASARRLLGTDGRVRLTRWSSTKDPELREAPEGLIDPWLRSVILLDGGDAVAALHWYATHPMSYYGDGVVTADFAGLARERRRTETPGCEHLYFNGCAGDITPGKYNEGTPASRERLTARIHVALVASEAAATVHPLQTISWRSADLRLPTKDLYTEETLLTMVRDSMRAEGDRRMAAQRLSHHRRAGSPCAASCLGLGTEIRILHLPGEPFIEYQLAATARRPFVAVAGYGDTGAGYIPLERSYAEGGYEVGDATNVSAAAERVLRPMIQELLGD